METLTEKQKQEAYNYLYDNYGDNVLFWEKDYLNLMIQDYFNTVKT